MKNIFLMIILCICFLSNKMHAKAYEFVSIGTVWLDEPLQCNEDMGWTPLEINQNPQGWSEYCEEQTRLALMFSQKLFELYEFDQNLLFNRVEANKAKNMMHGKILQMMTILQFEKEKRLKQKKEKQEALQIDAEMAREANEVSQAQEIDIDKPLTGRRFSDAKFRKAIKTRADRLIPCINKETEINPNQKFFLVEVNIINTGKVLNARLASGSQSGTRCVFKALQGLTVKPFDGGTYTGRIPFELE